MADPWLLAPPGVLEAGISVALDAEEARHATRVLRLRPGSRIVLTDGQGRVAEAVLRVVAKREVVAEVMSTRRVSAAGGAGVSIAVSVLHSQAMDWAVQKAVEVGVRSLLPVLASRGQLSRAAAHRRLDHWRRVALQALKQCRRPWAMEVTEPIGLVDLVRSRDPGGGLVADPRGQPLAEIARSEAPLLLIGPEGGLTPEEEECVSGARWARVRLGPHVMRAETAAVVGAALLVAQADRPSAGGTGSG